MHVGEFVRGKGRFLVTEYVPTDERVGPRFPLLLTTGRILSQYNVGAQTRRTDNIAWHAEDRLEIHPNDAELRGVKDGDWVKLASRSGETTLRALITERVAPGVVYTTFHHPATQELARAVGLDWNYTHPSQIMDEIAATTPTFSGVSFELLEREGSVQWPCNEKAPLGTPIMHIESIVRGKGNFVRTEYVATDEKVGPRFPLLLTTGRILSQYNVGAQTRRTGNIAWHNEDVLEIHPHDAEQRGIHDGDIVSVMSRAGETSLRAMISDRMQPGVVYTTFHHFGSGVNVVTTDFSDWATNCPEYKVTAVQVRPTNRPSEWQLKYAKLRDETRQIAGKTAAE
jgi:predicted molibdopterin-dependent oxidoreductase YjgC